MPICNAQDCDMELCFAKAHVALKECIEEGKEILGYDFLDTWDFEDEYSHNHIAKNRNKFIELANDYFKENNLPYVARETCERAKIFENERRE